MEYSYNIIDDVYNWMISSKKNVEVRILKEKSAAIQAGDFVIFRNQDNVGQFIKVKVLNKKIFRNISELLNSYDVENIMPGHTSKELKELMNNIYGKELLNKEIVAFEFEYLISDRENKIIEYEDKYLDDVKDLLVEIE